MKNTLTTLHRIKIYKPWILVILMPILLLPLFSQITIAQDEIDKPQGRKPYKLPPNLMQYFKEKYHISGDGLTSNVTSTVQETPNGPLGNLGVSGDIKPPKAAIKGETREERARATAMAFIREEADLFDITNMEEIRETKINTFKAGYSGEQTQIYYGRYIGDLPLSEVYIRIEIGNDEKITAVIATLRPTPPELYEAVKKETLSKEQVIKIIERDLASPEKRSLVKVHGTYKVADWRSPYVVWVAKASVGRKPAWGFTINAFSGEILSKGCTAIPFRYDPNFNPCK